MSETLAHNEIKHDNGTPHQMRETARMRSRARWDTAPAFRHENISKASNIAMWDFDPTDRRKIHRISTESLGFFQQRPNRP